MTYDLAVLKATLVLAAGVVALRAPRRQPAAARAAVCLLSLAGAMAAAGLSLAGLGNALPVDGAALRFLAEATSTGRSRAGEAASLLTAAWAAGATVVAARAAIGLWMVRRAIAGASAAPWCSAWRALDPALEVRVADVSTPLVCRAWSPVLLVPKTMADWPDGRVRPVLLHEAEHVRRRDLAANLIATAATATLWFHPLVWWFAARMRREQELACDDAVLNQGVAAHSYAEMLLEAIAGATDRRIFGCAMAGEATMLKERMKHILDSRLPRLFGRGAAISMSGLFLAGALVIGMARPALGERVYKLGKDVTAPKLVQKVEPEYTEAAKSAKVQGATVLRVVVGTDGKPHDVQVVKSLDPGLDQKARQAVEQWRFAPGRRKGKAVRVAAQIEVNFRLL